MGWLTIRDMPIAPGLYTSLIIMKVLGLGNKHLTELIMLLLDKVTKSCVLRRNIGSKEYFILLDGRKGGLDVSIVSGGDWEQELGLA